jgi:protein-disulfide isomerase
MNKIILIFFTSLIFIFSSSIIKAESESESSLARFVIRNYDSTVLPTVGSNDPDFLIVEFFDYRCGYCGQQADVFANLINKHDNVQIIYMEYPIFGGISLTASKIALNIWRNNPDLYFEIHNEFMNIGPKMKKKNLVNLLNSKGLDGKNIYLDAETEQDNEIINSNIKLAKQLGLRGTPASIVNDSIIPGYVRLSVLETIINQ